METGVINREGFGGSLPVEKVQALASKNLKDIPSRYIRPEVEFDVVSIDESYQIPVIDMSKLGHDDEQQKLHLACKDWGFFQLINHGVGDEVIDKMKIDVQEFFELPLNEKLACAQLPNNIEGYGQAFVVSEDQKLDWGDMLFLLPRPVPLRNMRFWPTIPPSFRETLDKYSMALQKVAIRLMRLIAKNLGTDLETFASFFEDGTQGIRMNYYPPCAQASKVIGLAPHSDSTALTLLIQVNEVEGLQIKKNGKWIPVKPISGAFIINIGDVMEIMSNGEYKSIEHRAVVNPNKERLSIAAFHSPNISTMIGPLPDVVKAKEAGYRTMPHEEFVRLTISSKLDGKGLLDQMKL
ncbi:hypothetical protein ERO13_D08G179500v2 [Gossypium hirsutum]|uniref:S-norcoclaurine synthase 1 n=5 Tax=Gossypium TaxID=3633 RepID=A0A1U8M3E7_GOSHI|nr:S-norcoclaurine synthase 1-like [Gossypium hirsutum]KAB2017923.1 hypothetical protein ES319_D08G195400v1 [Gossypium barbadense]TYG58245.1 hypothetical protein ES288_D08G207500v1 [Gossypium darwinii]TYH59135.1 hypothetical protein ES332_D08G203200v1 [Gossypium tomentosum]TYI70068.1 hypothetical protein E1A91_D08G196400v1 [Gossypium mustelinum]KAG4134801.1 hypothetical protein ERO13_D08G179500v2 [Gossypium hirsutum]